MTLSPFYLPLSTGWTADVMVEAGIAVIKPHVEDVKATK